MMLQLYRTGASVVRKQSLIPDFGFDVEYLREQLRNPISSFDTAKDAR